MAAMGQETAPRLHTVIDQEALSDDDGAFAYEELPEEFDDEDEDNLEDYNFLKAETKVDEAIAGDLDEGRALVEQGKEVVDDFIRNFFIRHEMKRSLDIFESEWYELQMMGKLRKADIEVVPSEYQRTHNLHHQITQYKVELEKARAVAAKAKSQWDKFRKERDFHRMHHKRVVQEKNRLLSDLKRLKKHYEQYEPTLTELRHKYECAMKEKMLMRLERDRFAAKNETLQKQIAQYEAKDEPDDEEKMQATMAKSKKTRDTPWPKEDRPNPNLSMKFEPFKTQDARLQRTFKGHLGSIARVTFHPRLQVIGTASDDHTWKLWSSPNGELVMSGEGHKDWVSDIQFHPKGNIVATTSGDATVKLWDMVKEGCTHTFADHPQAVWSCAFHDQGDFLVTSSMDHTTKIFDLNSVRCRQTLRGHVDSVNHVTFQPSSNNLCTCSGDKTVSLWDIRSGLCIQTFYGHANAVNRASFTLRGDIIASTDSDGLVKLWDVRMVSEYLQIDSGRHPANAGAFDRSGKVLAIASGDATVKLFDIEKKVFLLNFEGHEDAVQDVCFEPNGKFLVSSGSDCTFRMWH
jgi:WD40 repeat protein